MTSIKSIQQSISPELEALNSRIHESLHTENPLMNNVIETYLQKKGKQIRPIIVLLTAKLYGSVSERTLAAACSVELLHNASLIHDDVVDNSKMRRMSPTINAIWDNHIAVLVGDFFVSTAMQQAISTGNVGIIEALCHLGKLLSLGELDQIYNARFHMLTEQAYFNIITNKTASLFVACARMGCLSVGVADERLGVMTEFARLLGICFQIRDDIFDYYADDKVGKPTGNDLKEGKITLPLLHCLLDESNPEAEAMRELSRKEELNDDEISTLTSFAIANGGIDYAYETMYELRRRAADVLAAVPESEPKQALLSIFDNIITREY